jgi:hypothetical protein
MDEQAALAQALSELVSYNDLLSKENRLFDSYIQRTQNVLLQQPNSQNLSQSQTHPLQPQPHSHSQTLELPTFLPDDPSKQLTLSEFDRNKIALEEMDYRSKQFASLKQKAELDSALVTAIRQSIALRTAQIKKEANVFHREICSTNTSTNNNNNDNSNTNGSRNSERKTKSNEWSRLQSINSNYSASINTNNNDPERFSSAKVMRWFNDRLHDKQNEIEKYRMKMKTMKILTKKCETQLKQKSEAGDSLHSIDFHQLQIKNSQYTTKIAEKNELLLALKLNTGKVIQQVNEEKRRLNEELHLHATMKKEMNERQHNIVRMIEDIRKLAAEVENEERKNQKYRMIQSNPDMPSVMDYYVIKRQLEELQKEEKELQRKIEIERIRCSVVE